MFHRTAQTGQGRKITTGEDLPRVCQRRALTNVATTLRIAIRHPEPEAAAAPLADPAVGCKVGGGMFAIIAKLMLYMYLPIGVPSSTSSIE